MKPASMLPASETTDQKMIRAYLNDPHPLHIRRTLDQYYYHSMESTAERDKDQTVSRHLISKGLEPTVLTVVDQLWLWVLGGDNRRADAVITCFPQRDSSKDVDRHDFTDILRNIKLKLSQDAGAICGPWDLASMITSECSRAYLTIGALEETPGFSETYELAVGDVVCIPLFRLCSDARLF